MSLLTISLATLVLGAAASRSVGSEVPPPIRALINSACIHCHDQETETGLDFQRIGYELNDASSSAIWEKVFDRTDKGEMPPASEARPDEKQLADALALLKTDLHRSSASRQQTLGRVLARRLTKLELQYTLQDIFKIRQNVTGSVPAEIASGSFDTVGVNQRISAVHMESYLDAADRVLEQAIQLGANPYTDFGDYAQSNFAHLEEWHTKPLIDGGSITRKLKYGNGVALFRDIDYLTTFTYGIRRAGTYRMTFEVAAFQSKDVLTAKLIVKSQSGNASLVKAVDLTPGEPKKVTVETELKPGDTPYLTFVEPELNAIFSAGGAANFRGPGLAILSQRIEGPIYKNWPTESTRALLPEGSVLLSDQGHAQFLEPENAKAAMRETIANLAPRLFRRPVNSAELQPFLALANPALKENRGYTQSLQVILRSMLSSPQFLLFEESPGELNDFALASRLSYFLWRSLPDQSLFDLAADKQLSNPEVLHQQVERMLGDPKAQRFYSDFAGQWLRLYQVNATTPDDGLYPEYDELLGASIPQETELFLEHLIAHNLSLSNLIDSDFTILNRRLAEHYGIEGVEGQHFRRVDLPGENARGGILTQAAVLKTTANGTTTSPVIRGNFVLTNFLGTPPSPPPPDVGSIEPDTRGKTTIREILQAHRDLETCNQCHKEIDPPGFALECFDPIGGFRTHYRTPGGESTFGGFTTKRPPRRGRRVDSSGHTSLGEDFTGITEFKQLLMRQREQVVRNFVSRLMVFGTGAEIQFADRDEIEAIVHSFQSQGYPARDIVHAVVQSQIFRNK